jgi:hypothetical protein
MARDERGNDDFGTDFLKRGEFGTLQGLRRIVSSLGVYVRSKGANLLGEARAWKDQHRIHKTQATHGIGAIFGTIERATRPLQGAYRFVTVEGYNEKISQRGGLAEVFQMPTMQKVKAAVRQDNTPPILPGGITERNAIRQA